MEPKKFNKLVNFTKKEADFTDIEKLLDPSMEREGAGNRRVGIRRYRLIHMK